LNWKEYAVLTEGQCVEAVAGIFHSLGSGGVSIAATQTEIGYVVEGKENINPVSQDYLAHDLVVVKAYFPEDRDIITDLEQSLQLVETNFKVQSRLMLGEVREEDWAESWKKYYHCFKIGERLVIKPSWEEYDPQPGEVLIALDPGMAFGTGSHASTRFCLIFIDQYVKGGENIIDAGCGSGILSIAAAKLGAQQVLAMDFDALAVKIARANVTLNGLEDIVKVEVGDITEDLAGFKADYIFANITAEVVYMLIPWAAQILSAGAYLFCSGIIESRWPEVQRQLESYGFVIDQLLKDSEWLGVAARKI
jgi:ribosomal protein L11 methyltransferase